MKSTKAAQRVRRRTAQLASVAILALVPSACRTTNTARPSIVVDEVELQSLVDDLGRDTATRKHAIERITRLGSAAIPQLVANLEYDDWQVRWYLVNQLGDLADDAGFEGVLERTLSDPENHVRWRALWALQRIDHPTTDDRVRAELSSADSERRWNAAIAGSLFGVAESMPVILDLLPTRRAFAVTEGVNALGRFDGPESVEALCGLRATSRTYRVRREAVVALARRDGPRALDCLIDALGDTDNGARKRAVRLLIERSEEKAAVALRRHVDSETEPALRRQIERYLDTTAHQTID